MNKTITFLGKTSAAMVWEQANCQELFQDHKYSTTQKICQWPLGQMGIPGVSNVHK